MPTTLQDLMGAYITAGSRQFGGVAITYKLQGVAPINVAAQTQTTKYIDVAIPYALKDSVRMRDLTPGGVGPVQFQDVVFTFEAAILKARAAESMKKRPTAQDLIIEGSTTFKVVAVEELGNGTVYRVYARRADG